MDMNELEEELIFNWEIYRVNFCCLCYVCNTNQFALDNLDNSLGAHT